MTPFSLPGDALLESEPLAQDEAVCNVGEAAFAPGFDRFGPGVCCGCCI